MSHVTATNFLNVTHKALVAAAAVFPTLLIKAYLVTYNLLSAAGWSFVLYRTISHLSALQSSQHVPISLLAGLKATPSPFLWIPSFIPANLVPLYQRACTTYDAVGATTASVQTAAVLEILHVLLGFVRSSLATTTIQVASRLFSVWAIAACFPTVRCPIPPHPYPDLTQKKNLKKKLHRPKIAHSTPVWCSPGRSPKSYDIRSTLPRSSGGNPLRSSGHVIPLSSSCTRLARALKHSSTLPRFPFPSRAGGPGSPHCRYPSGTSMLSCGPYSSSGGGRVGNPFFVFPVSFPPSSF
jgi:hypothetical protein